MLAKSEISFFSNLRRKFSVHKKSSNKFENSRWLKIVILWKKAIYKFPRIQVYLWFFQINQKEPKVHRKVMKCLTNIVFDENSVFFFKKKRIKKRNNHVVRAMESTERATYVQFDFFQSRINWLSNYALGTNVKSCREHSIYDPDSILVTTFLKIEKCSKSHQFSWSQQ